MATPLRSDSLSLEIKTKSVEQTLIPLVTQITTLVNHKEKARKSEKTVRALVRVGQAVNLAVERFVTVGEAIAAENTEIKNEMCEACKEACLAGAAIQQLTDIAVDETGQPRSLTEKTSMVRAARQLLSAITRVLILADRVVIKQIVDTKEKVTRSLDRLESVTSFTEFVKLFSQFGNEMVELAHVTGDRQNDLKNDKQRAQMAVARSILEKSTMMLLTASKTCLRHPDCESARKNRDCVFRQMYKALDFVQQIVCDVPPSNVQLSQSQLNGDSGIGLSQQQITAHKALREFEDLLEMSRVTLIDSSMQEKMPSALETVIETAQDFTDSAYTSHEHREKIVQLCEKARLELDILLRIGGALNDRDSSPNQELETAIIRTGTVAKSLRKQLQETAMDQASEVFHSNEEQELFTALRNAGSNGEKGAVDEVSVKFEEHSEQLQEVCKLLRHVAGTEALMTTAEYIENNLKYLGPQTILSAQTLAMYPASKIARENVDVFTDAWEAQINELSALVKDINDVYQGRADRQVYMSLPRPGKHGTTLKSPKPVKLNAEEQAKIAKLGLEMKLITSEMDAETEKWEEPDNDIVKRAKNMSSMAFSMYLFTRGEGPLRTTQDLFTQAEYFAEEGNKLYKTVKEFAQKIPVGGQRSELVAYLDKIPTFCQQLHFTIKSPTVGKTATFNKVDSAIQETKNLMNAVSKVVTTCFICSTKYNIDYHGSPSVTHKWRTPPQLDIRSNGSDTESVKSDGAVMKSTSFQKHVASMNAFEQL
ncbi:alpha-catulin isoform X2 [Lingula anatina]|uniref:Alpha-catulin isoform X2 n=1 Tax=Lingula anatina TaxID=7574 RepID=A0A1S3JDR4_LINAN|nr:alpha-catulin isoform X2 [Lingula anatina]|eukprot:XP_013408473.1 alpha-catulin isoform X2 [Lingula anatina]